MDIHQRLESLQQERLPSESIDVLLGVDPTDSFLWGSFRRFLLQSVLYSSDVAFNSVPRIPFEMFLLRRRFLTLRNASLRVGMSEESFCQVLDALDNRGVIILDRQALECRVVDETLTLKLYRHFDSMQSADSHMSYCRQLHDVILRELGIEVVPVLCESASHFGERAYAIRSCALTGSPVSTRYEVVLDLQPRPMRLLPDVCASHIYLKHQDLLSPFSRCQ